MEYGFQICPANDGKSKDMSKADISIVMLLVFIAVVFFEFALRVVCDEEGDSE